MASLKNKPLYLWDFYFIFSDILTFIEFSERNIDWQRRSHELILERKAKIKKYTRDDYWTEMHNIEYRFEVLLARSIRYSAVIALATSIEWIANFLKKRSGVSLEPKLKKITESIHILQQFYKLVGRKLRHNLETLEKIFYVRNCIAHTNGSIEKYKHRDDILAIMKSLKGFGVSDQHYLGEVIDIDKGAIETIIKETESWIIDFVEECRKKNLINV